MPMFYVTFLGASKVFFFANSIVSPFPTIRATIYRHNQSNVCVNDTEIFLSGVLPALHPQFNVMLREMKTFLGSWCEFWQRERPAYFRRHGRWLQCDKAKNICKSNFMHSYLAHILVLVDTGRYANSPIWQ